MSMISEFQRCRRKWYYHHGLGLEPKDLPDYIGLGSAVHAGIANIYAHYAECTADSLLAYGFALRGVALWLNENDDAKKFNKEQVELVIDMIDYWWWHQGKKMIYKEIVAVEEHIPLKIGKYEIRCTPDLVAKRADGKLVVVDHKTVGTIGDSLAFLPLDFQLKCYALTVWDKYGAVPELDYNMIRRELPPDFIRTADGSTPYALTKTGRQSTRSCDPTDYVRLERQVFTPESLMSFAENLEIDILEIEHAIETGRFPRSVSKAGAFGCGGCPYLAQCTRQLDGHALDGITLGLEFNLREPVLKNEQLKVA